MKKPYLLIVVPLVLLAAGWLGLNFWLRPAVEEQVRLAVQGITLSPDGRPSQSSAQQVEFSPLSRKLTLTGLNLRGNMPDGPFTYSVAEVTLNVPLRMLPAFTPLRGMALPKTGMTPVAENITLRNIAWRMPAGHGDVQREEIDVLRAESGLIARVLDGQPVSMLEAVYHMGADNARLFSITADTPATAVKTTIGETSVSGWQGASIAAVRLNGLRVAREGKETARMAGVMCKDIALPAPGLMNRLMDAVNAHEGDTEALVNSLSPIMDEMTAAGTPLLGQARADGLVLSDGGNSISLAEIGYDQLSSAPRHIAFFLRGLAVPRAMIAELTELQLPDITLELLRYEGQDQSNASSRQSLILKAPGLADIDCAFTRYDAGPVSGEQALLLQSFSDLRLNIQDLGALAWLGRNINADPAKAAADMRNAVAGLEFEASPRNDELRATLLSFINHPGKLEIRTARDKRIGLALLLQALENPAALLTLRAAPGPHTLEEQMRALPATTPATPLQQ